MRFTVFEAPTNQIEHPLPLVAPAQEALRETALGEVRHVEAPAQLPAAFFRMGRGRPYLAQLQTPNAQPQSPCCARSTSATTR